MSGKVIASADIIGVIPAANLPPSGGGAPVNAPYLLNGADPSGLLTAEVNVLALSAPQPFIATAAIFADIGQPLTIAYDPGAAGAANTGAAVGFQAQNDADAAVQIGGVAALLTDATAGSVDSAIALNVSAASATVTAALVDNTGILLDGTGAKTITTSKGNLTVSATGAGNGVAVSSAAAGAAVTGQTTASLTATTGAASVVATAAGASVTGATTAAVTAGTILTLTGADRILLQTAAAGNGVQVLAGAVPTWIFDDAASLNGRLVAAGSARPISNVSPSTTTGDVVVFEQILDAGQAAPTNGGATVPIVPGAEFIATATFTAPTGGAGTFLLQNNTGRAITIIGARAVIPAAGANTLALTIDNAGGTDLFTVAALAATGGTHVPAATTYTLAEAVIANGANIIITAEGSGATIDTILFLEFIVQ